MSRERFMRGWCLVYLVSFSWQCDSSAAKNLVQKGLVN